MRSRRRQPANNTLLTGAWPCEGALESDSAPQAARSPRPLPCCGPPCRRRQQRSPLCAGTPSYRRGAGRVARARASGGAGLACDGGPLAAAL